jgi:hypothetical protein
MALPYAKIILANIISMLHLLLDKCNIVDNNVNTIGVIINHKTYLLLEISVFHSVPKAKATTIKA